MSLRTEKSMEMSKTRLDHVPSCPMASSLFEICQRVIKSFDSDFCLGRRRDKTSAGYKCNFHSEPSSVLLPVSVRSIDRVFGSESLLSAEPTKTVENNKRAERDRELKRGYWSNSRLYEILFALLLFYSHDANVW